MYFKQNFYLGTKSWFAICLAINYCCFQLGFFLSVQSKSKPNTGFFAVHRVILPGKQTVTTCYLCSVVLPKLIREINHIW